MTRYSTFVALTAISLALMVSCSKSDKATPSEGEAKNAPRVDDLQAREIFNTRCAVCHGPEGNGLGPASAALNPKPRNYHDKAWQAKVSDNDLRKTITYGGAAVGKSAIMPANPDLEAKPEVIEGLVHIVRSFGKS